MKRRRGTGLRSGPVPWSALGRLAGAVSHGETTVSYLLGEVEEDTLLKDPVMLERLKTLHALPEEQRRHILYALDAMLRDAKTSQA